MRAVYGKPLKQRKPVLTENARRGLMLYKITILGDAFMPPTMNLQQTQPVDFNSIFSKYCRSSNVPLQKLANDYLALAPDEVQKRSVLICRLHLHYADRSALERGLLLKTLNAQLNRLSAGDPPQHKSLNTLLCLIHFNEGDTELALTHSSNASGAYDLCAQVYTLCMLPSDTPSYQRAKEEIFEQALERGNLMVPHKLSYPSRAAALASLSQAFAMGELLCVEPYTELIFNDSESMRPEQIRCAIAILTQAAAEGSTFALSKLVDLFLSTSTLISAHGDNDRLAILERYVVFTGRIDNFDILVHGDVVREEKAAAEANLLEALNWLKKANNPAAEHDKKPPPKALALVAYSLCLGVKTFLPIAVANHQPIQRLLLAMLGSDEHFEMTRPLISAAEHATAAEPSTPVDASHYVLLEFIQKTNTNRGRTPFWKKSPKTFCQQVLNQSTQPRKALELQTFKQ
jgi:hypothetical protein